MSARLCVGSRTDAPCASASTCTPASVHAFTRSSQHWALASDAAHRAALRCPRLLPACLPLQRQAQALVTSCGMDPALPAVLRELWLAFLAHSRLLEPATIK